MSDAGLPASRCRAAARRCFSGCSPPTPRSRRRRSRGSCSRCSTRSARPGAYAEYGHRTAARAIARLLRRLPGGPRRRTSTRCGVRRSRSTTGARATRLVPGQDPALPPGRRRDHGAVPRRAIHLPVAKPARGRRVDDRSFGRGHWNLDRYEVDLHGGLERLVAAAGRDDPRASPLRFEDVVADPDAATARDLRVPRARPGRCDGRRVRERRPDGRMGDRTGTASTRRSAASRSSGGGPRWAIRFASAGARRTWRVGRSGSAPWGMTPTSCASEVDDSPGRRARGLRCRPQGPRPPASGARVRGSCTRRPARRPAPRRRGGGRRPRPTSSSCTSERPRARPCARS